MLRSNVQRAAKCKQRRPPPQRLFSGNARHRRIVILLGKMRENEMPRQPVKHFAIRQEIAHGGIREMPRSAHHSLLDVPRIRPHLQHFEIVIRFQNQKIGFAQMMFHELRQVAKIGDDRDLDSMP